MKILDLLQDGFDFFCMMIPRFILFRMVTG